MRDLESVKEQVLGRQWSEKVEVGLAEPSSGRHDYSGPFADRPHYMAFVFYCKQDATLFKLSY